MSDTKLIIMGCSPNTNEAAAFVRECAPDRPVEIIELTGRTRYEFDLSFIDALSPEGCEVLVALDARGLNFIRTQIVSVLKSKGFKLARLISSRASVPAGLRIGENSIIYPGVVITADVTIGFNVVIKAGCILEIGSKVGNSAYLESGVVLGAGAVVGDNATIGNSVVIGPQVTIGKQCEIMIPMTYVNNVPDKTFYVEGYDGPVRIVKF